MPDTTHDLPEVGLEPAPVTYEDYVAFIPEKLELVQGHLIEAPDSTEQRRKLLALLLKNLGLVEAVRLVPEEKWREALRLAYSDRGET